jgi:para-nitrobenzyl esterase
MAITMDTTLGEILDNPQAKAVLDKHFPGASSNPMIGMARGMSLNTILSMPQAQQLGLTREKVQGMMDEVNRL